MKLEELVIASGADKITVAVASPNGSARHGAVIVLHEWWGLNTHIKDIVARWANAGFLAIAPDLYRGVIAGDASQAQHLMTTLPVERAIADIGAALEFAKRHPRSNGKVVVSGFCMGGALTLRSAATYVSLAGAIAFYGVPGQLDYSKISAPIMMHVADRDEWVTPALAEQARLGIAKGGAACTVHHYQADHAFFNDTRKEVYNPQSASLAWQRSVEFAKQVTA